MQESLSSKMFGERKNRIVFWRRPKGYVARASTGRSTKEEYSTTSRYKG
jgi:hypothetical protein